MGSGCVAQGTLTPVVRGVEMGVACSEVYHVTSCGYVVVVAVACGSFFVFGGVVDGGGTKVGPDR